MAARRGKKGPCHTCGARVAHHCPPHKLLRCVCGGSIVLGGDPAPLYTCAGCGRSSSTLFAEHIVPLHR